MKKKNYKRNYTKSFSTIKRVFKLFPGLLAQSIDMLRTLFTLPTFANFVTLFVGTVLSVGKRTISRIIMCARIVGKLKHFTVFYKFFCRAVWSVEDISEVLCKLVLNLLRQEPEIFVIIDDTLFERRSKRIWGVCTHFDTIQSSKGNKKTLTLGHNWVILSIWVPLPCGSGIGIALPVLFRLYRNKKTSPKKEYKKRTTLALEMIQKLRTLIPLERKIWIIGDNEFVCKPIINNLPPNCNLIGPIRSNSVLHDAPVVTKRRGRPAKKGPRLPSIKEILSDSKYPWEERRAIIYGELKKVRYKTLIAISHHLASGRKVRVVITPKQNYGCPTQDPSAFLSTDVSLDAIKVLSYYCRRWPQEIAHREAKQIGAGDSQNGFSRSKRKRASKVSSSASEESRRRAVLRTVPYFFIIYTLVSICFLRKRKFHRALSRAKRLRCWYNTKKTPSFSTMLLDLRIEILRKGISQKALAHPEVRRIFSYLECVLTEV